MGAHTARADSGAPVLVAFGDSLTAGYGLGPGESFPEQLEKALRARGVDVRVVNAGVSGDTTSGGLARLEWSLPAEADAVILELGANDGLRGIDPALSERNLEAMLEAFAAKGLPVLLSGMKAPPNMGRDYARAFDAVYPALAARFDVLFDPFFLEKVAAMPELNQADGIHPNADGVALIVERLLPSVENLLARARSGM